MERLFQSFLVPALKPAVPQTKSKVVAVLQHLQHFVGN
jgi:hypothetical protein